jgi:hypothetical protein
MASIIKIKRSSVQGKAPTTSTLNSGEIALNTRDGKIFVNDGSKIVELGANSTLASFGEAVFGNVNVTTVSNTGQWQFNNDLRISTSKEIVFDSYSYSNQTKINHENSALNITQTNSDAKVKVSGGAGLDLSGTANVGNLSIAGAYSLPNYDGGSGEFLKTDGSGNLSWSTAAGALGSQFVANSYFQPILANTNAYIASVAASNTSVTSGSFASTNNTITFTRADSSEFDVVLTGVGEVTNAYVTSTYVTNTDFQSALANTNLYIATKTDDSTVLATNTTLRALISDRIQVANVTSTYVTNSSFQSYVSNTEPRLSTLESTTTANAYVSSTFVTNTVFQSALANTNAYIATKTDDSTVLATNTALRTLISDRIQVANLNATLADYWPSANVISYVDTEVASIVNSAPSTLDTLNELAAALNDDANFATTVTTNLGQKLGATASVTLTGDVTGSGSFSSNAVSIAVTIDDSFATNTNLETQSNRIDLVNTNLTNTNTALRTLISDRIQVANLNATIAGYVTNTVFQSALANTNSYIATTAATELSHLANTNARIDLVNTNLTGTNTSLRTLISDRLQVANATLQVITATGNTTTHEIKVGGLEIANAFSLPKVDGTANGQVLISGANGTTYWGTAAAGGITTENNDKVIRSDEGFYILMDTDNDSSTTEFQVRKDTNLKTGGNLLFSVRSDGRTKFNDAFTLPNADGNNGQALITDGSGGVNWGSVVSSDDLDDVIARNPQVSSNVFFNADTTANNFFVEGDLLVSGNVTTISSEELNVDTSFIVLNANLTSSLPPLLDAGIEVNRGSSPNAQFYWDESGNRWHVTYGGGSTLIDRAIPITLHDVLNNGFASNNNITINGTSTLADADITELTINNQFTFPQNDGNQTQVLATHGNGQLYWIASNNELRSSISMRQMNFTANTDQTFFNGVDDDGTILRYEVGKTSVFLNGIKLKLNIDYSATTGNSLTLTEPAANGDILMIDAFGYEESVRLGNTSVIATAGYAANSTNEQVIDSFNTTDFDSAQFIVKATDQGKIHMTTVNCIYAFSNVHITEYGTLQSNGSLMTLDATYSSNVVSLKATPVTSSVKFQVHRTTLRNY